MGFSNPIIGGGGSLVYPSIHSPGFDVQSPMSSPTPSWAILKNGLAYFFGLFLQGGTITGPDYIFNSQGIFFYSSTPALGNLVAWFAPLGGTDSFGNAFTEGLNIGGSSQNVAIIPDQNSAFNITTAIAGVLESIVGLSSGDVNQAVQGILGSLQLNTGTATKQTTVLGSPLTSAGTGAYLMLEAENDGATDTPVITFGTVTTPDNGDTLTYTPILTIGPYYLLLYGGASGQTTVTKTSGSGTITGLPATVRAQAWGAGASTAGVSGGATTALGGNGSGGYSEEPALATAGSVTYSVSASANAPGGSTADTTIVGSAVTVTAHGGKAGTGASFGTGAPASGNTIAHPGADGGARSTHSPNAGGGGGGGGSGPSGSGNSGNGGSPTAGGLGGLGVGGANGGNGGAPNNNATAGLFPGAGGGGGGSDADGAIGGSGQIKVTYTGTAPVIAVSIASAAGTDQFGTAFPAGVVLPGPGDGNKYNSGPDTNYLNLSIPINSLSAISLFTFNVAAGVKYRIRGAYFCTQGSVGPGNQAVGFAGTATMSQMNIGVTAFNTTAGAGALLASFEGNTLGTRGSVGTPPLNDTFTVFFDGTFHVNAAGTIILNASCVTAAADSFSVRLGSYMEITPALNT